MKDQEDHQALLAVLQERFEKNQARHPKTKWEDVEKKLNEQPKKMASLLEMERSGGEPDVVTLDPKSNAIAFVDCSPESPSGRRSLCFDDTAHASRKEHKPAGSAMGVAAKMGIEILSETQYRALQALGKFDGKTSSWVATPNAIRALGGALFCDRRYETVFTYHNGAESYYAARGFRGFIEI